jgi:hypothetical protein
MSINSILFNSNSSLREPALLNLDKASNYDSLAAYLANEESSSASTTAITDKVDLALDKVAGKIITELAAITANAIGDNPELADDYLLAIIEENGSREVRVYSRQEIVENSGLSDEEKEKLAEELAKQPLMAFSSSEGLPESSTSEAYQSLQADAANFLKINSKLLDNLDKYGYNPFSSLLQSELV